jgi:hypothetical protein
MSEPAVDLSNAERREYWPGPVALEAHRSKARVKLAYGPLATSKTTWLVWRSKAICERAAKAGYTARCLFVRDTYRNLIDSTFQTFKEWFPDGTAAGYVSQSDPVDFKLNVGGRYHDVLFRHGQTEQDASMFLSTEYDFIGLEEIAPAYIPGEKKVSPGIAEGVFDMAISRLTRKGDRAAAVRPELCMTCNSPPLTHWASKRIIDKPPEYLTDPVLNWAHWMFPVSDNAHNLDANYYASLEKAWEGKHQLIARFLRGERIAVFVGIPRFDMDQLDALRKLAVEPPFRGFLLPTQDNPLQVKLEANPSGWVKMWAPPKSGRRYTVGADCSEGVDGGDYSAAYVLDCEDCSIVAAWWGRCEPGRFAQELVRLGGLYHDAQLGVENNPGGHGNLVLERIKDYSYPNVYTHRPIEIRNPQPNRFGFRTDMRTKPMLIDNLGEYLDALGKKGEHGSINDAELIGELQTFGIMENGKTEAQAGCYDDRVLAFSIALLVQQRSGLESIYPSLRRGQ